MKKLLTLAMAAALALALAGCVTTVKEEKAPTMSASDESAPSSASSSSSSQQVNWIEADTAADAAKGAGIGTFGVMDEIDLYIGAFAKSMASIGGFVAGPKYVINYLRCNMRSQIYAKSLPMAFVLGNIKRMEIIDSPKGDEQRRKCWEITHAIQNGFKELGFDIGEAEACVTPIHIPGGVGQATRMVKDLRENYKIFCSTVVYPVIPKGMVIFRIVSTAAHTMEDVRYTLNAFKEIRDKLETGAYDGDDIESMTIE